MKHTITVFIEGKPPVEVEVGRETTVKDVLKQLKVTRPNSTWLSTDKVGPSTIGDKFWVAESGYSYKPIAEQKGEFRYKALWVGFIPTGSRPKWYYKWVGNDKLHVEWAKMHEDFSRHVFVIAFSGISANFTFPMHTGVFYNVL